ncbi:hypothetical protein EBR57_10975 [bacterium]|nr:hypothetical protein [bacterium]
MDHLEGMGLLEIVISISIVMIFFGVTFPLWATLYRQMTQVQTRIRHQCHLNWLADRICDDVQFSGTPSVWDTTLTIAGSSTITYQKSGTSIRRQTSGTTQTLSTFPITQWQAWVSGNTVSIIIHTAVASTDRTCTSW